MIHKFILDFCTSVFLLFFFGWGCVNIMQICWRQVSWCCARNLFLPAFIDNAKSLINKNKNMHSRLTFITSRLIHRRLLHRDFASCFWPAHLSCIYSHSKHCQALWTIVNVLVVSKREKYEVNTDPKVNYVTYSSFSEWNVTSKQRSFSCFLLVISKPLFIFKRLVSFLFPSSFILSWTILLCYSFLQNGHLPNIACFCQLFFSQRANLICGVFECLLLFALSTSARK